MSELKKISGIITTTTILTHHETRTDYDEYDNRMRVHGKTTYWTVFRVNNTPCRFKGRISLNNGDRVTVVGKGKGELNIWVLYNDTTKIRYSAREKAMIGLVVSILFSISIIWYLGNDPIFLFIGLIGLLAAVYFYLYKKGTDNAFRLLAQN
jgi:hypothetical protein